MTRRSRPSRYENERRERSERARSHYARVQQRKATSGQRRAAFALAFATAFAAGYAMGHGNSEVWLETLETREQAVESISVLGNHRVAIDEIAERSGIAPGAYVDGVDFEAAAQRIESHPWLRSARLRRLPGGEVLAIVDERSASAALNTARADVWQAVDRDGTAFAEIDPSAHPDLLRLRCDDTDSSAQDLSAAIELDKLIQASGIARPAAIVLPARNSGKEAKAIGWRLLLADAGPEVVLGEVPSGERLSRLAELLEAQLDEVRSAERIDLRFRDRAILRAADPTPADPAPAGDVNAAQNETESAGESARDNDLGERPASA